MYLQNQRRFTYNGDAANPNFNNSLRSSERSSTAIPACHSIDSKWLNFCWLTKGSARK
jgi:hypothetical protein